MEDPSMADNAYYFRSALSGFHKGDVTAYIEKTAVQHRNELLEKEQIITGLRDEIRSLQQQLNLLMMSTPVAAEPVSEPVVQPEPDIIPEPMSEPAPDELMSMELQAYRRAEAAERSAHQRARNLYRQMEDLCEDALGEFQVTDSTVKQTLDSIMTQANSLEHAYRSLSAALQTSREKLAAINALIADAEEDPNL